MICLYFEGDPVPKARARVTRRGRAYTPAKTHNWERAVALMARQQMSTRRLQALVGPIDVALEFAICPPESWSKRKRDRACAGEIRPMGREGDVDNLGKAVLDALNGLVFADDRQVVSLALRKFYARSGGVWCRLRPCPVLDNSLAGREPWVEEVTT